MSLSEASSVESMMSLASSEFKHWSASGAQALAAVVKVFANYQEGSPQNVVIKCAAGGLATLSTVRRLWPNVPCLVLCRNPIEVLVFNLQKPAPWISGWYYSLGSNPYGVPPDEVAARAFRWENDR